MISISDRAKAITACQQQIYELNESAKILSELQLKAHKEFAESMQNLSEKHIVVLKKIIALEDTINDIIRHL